LLKKIQFFLFFHIKIVFVCAKNDAGEMKVIKATNERARAGLKDWRLDLPSPYSNRSLLTTYAQSLSLKRRTPQPDSFLRRR
jgi:hypothetical protein